MTSDRNSLLESAILFTYCLFAFGSTFSIALAQLSIGICSALFVGNCFATRHNPFAGQARALYIAMASLVGWKIFTALICPHPFGALSAMREDWLYLAVPAGVWLMQKTHHRRLILGSLLSGAVLVSLYAFIQNATGYEYRGKILPPAPDFGFRVIGTFPHQLTFGNFYAVVAMTFLGAGIMAYRNSIKPWNTVLLGASLLTAVASGLSYSRGSMIAMVPGIAAGVWLLAKFKARWLAVALLVIAGGFVATHPGIVYRMSNEIAGDQSAGNAMGRPFIWKHSVEVIQSHFLFGTGPGQFKEAYVSTLPPNTIERAYHPHAHNDFLTVAAESGVPGALLFGVLFTTLVRLIIKGTRLVLFVDSILPVAALFGIATFLLTGLTEATFYDEEVRQMLMIVWAFGLWPLGNALATRPDLAGKSS